jgi:hypothetical protein
MYSFKPSLLHSSKSRLWLTVLCASLSIVTAISSTANIPALSQPTNLQRTVKPTPNFVIQSIRQAVKQQFGIAQITVVSLTEQNWPDGCLGLPKGQEACTQVIVPGWRVEVTDNLQTWFYRSDDTGKTLRLENPDRPVLSQPVARKLIQKVAQENHFLSKKLRITEVKEQVYDSCLSIYRPNQACTKIGISGWQAIITSPNQTFIYHLSKNATRIAQNTIASGAQRAIRVSFTTPGENSRLAANEVFRSSSSGDFAGRTVSTVLTQDGKITQYQSSPTARFAPVVIKTLSPNQLNVFKKMLDNRQFPNLNGLSYLTVATVADYPTTVYQSQSTAIQFIDLEKKNLPRSLQQVIMNWQFLITPA